MFKDLLRQAHELARFDASKPRQVNLRRAVSAAYYALFHALVDEACRGVMGAQHDQGPFRCVLARSFAHGTMKHACASFSGGTLKAAVAKGLPPTFQIPREIRTLASTFVELQEKRHLADYDLTERFTRSDVMALIEQAETVIEEFAELPPSNERKFFLACLWAWSGLANR